MALSLPSKKISNVDVPEVSNFDAKFIYNFFVPDEKVNDSGRDAPEFIRSRASRNFDTGFVDSVNFKRFVPRLVQFSWKPQRTISEGRKTDLDVNIKDNIDRIHNEQTFTTVDYTNTYFQDSTKDEELRFYLNRILSQLEAGPDTDKEISPLEVVKLIRENTDGRIDDDFLQDVFVKLKEQGYSFRNEQGEPNISKTFLDEIDDVRIRAQINNKVLNKSLKPTADNARNLFNRETNELLKQAEQIQQKAISQKNSSILDGEEYDFRIENIVNYRKIDPNAFTPAIQVIGYIIDKEEVTGDGNIVNHDPIIVESPSANTTIDLKIRYGSRYIYTIRSIALIEQQVEDEDANSVVAASFLVSSKPSEQVIVETEEEVPPPAPADFKVEWDYSEDAPLLLWNFPVNTQRDVKQFQVFRRQSINEPFELLSQYDFDDSVVRSEQRENPDPALIERLSTPKSFYLDREFEKDSRFIYAVCAIDAHGFTSNYSIQYEVTFNRFKNKVELKLISLSGAPKAYPNMFLQRDTFVDSIRDSGHDKVSVFFNPEYLKVVDNQEDDLRLLKTTEDAEYRLQLINVDLQQQQVVKFKLLDKRTTTENNNE